MPDSRKICTNHRIDSRKICIMFAMSYFLMHNIVERKGWKNMKAKRYEYANLKKMDLNSLYEGSQRTEELLEENILEVVRVEAPVTMNTLKARLREAFNIGKISQKALDIINDIIKDNELVITDNLYDKVLWPRSGEFKVDYLRDGDRQIYDIPHQEMKNLVIDLNKNGEELYRAILAHFGGQVLSKKAELYLRYCEEMACEE